MVRHCPASQSLITQIQIGLSVYQGGGGGAFECNFMQAFPRPCAG